MGAAVSDDRDEWLAQFLDMGTQGTNPWAIRWSYYDPAAMATRWVEMDVITAARLLHTIQRDGIDHAIDLLAAGVRLAGYALLSDEQFLHVHAALSALQSDVALVADAEELLLRRTYELLRDKRITRDGAATLASALFGLPITTDAFRKRVDRWAETHGLPPLGQTKRRPRKLSGQ